MKQGNLGVAIDSYEPYGRRWLFAFGAYGWTRVLVLGADPSLEDALEIAADWLAENAPGIFAEAESEEDEADMTYTQSGWIPSCEWSVLENPDRETIVRAKG